MERALTKKRCKFFYTILLWMCIFISDCKQLLLSATDNTHKTTMTMLTRWSHAFFFLNKMTVLGLRSALGLGFWIFWLQSFKLVKSHTFTFTKHRTWSKIWKFCISPESLTLNINSLWAKLPPLAWLSYMKFWWILSFKISGCYKCQWGTLWAVTCLGYYVVMFCVQT